MKASLNLIFISLLLFIHILSTILSSYVEASCRKEADHACEASPHCAGERCGRAVAREPGRGRRPVDGSNVSKVLAESPSGAFRASSDDFRGGEPRPGVPHRCRILLAVVDVYRLPDSRRRFDRPVRGRKDGCDVQEDVALMR